MTEERTTAYLLNELSESEAEQFEEQCFSQTEWPDAELESAEEDLIQAYIKNELSAERRRRFEEYYLTTEARKERLLLTKSFLRIACSANPAKVSWWQRLGTFLSPQTFGPRATAPKFAAVILAIGLIVAVSWLALPPRAPQTFANITLAISSDDRSANAKSETVPVPYTRGVVKLPLAEDALRITLALPEPAPAGTTYRVQWEDVKGLLENLNIEQQDANSISVIIPAEKLKPGQYTLKLFRKAPDGTESRVPGNYFFSVE